MNSLVIEAEGLMKRYGSQIVVDSLDLTIAKGEVFGLLGPNGAGKTTTILMLMGMSEPHGGTIRVCGINPVTHPLSVKRKVGYLPEDVGFYDDYSGIDNLVYTARLNGQSPAQARHQAEQLLRRIGLWEDAHKKTGKFSRGMRQRLGLADVLMKSPEVIILDEPTLGIDPTGVRELMELIVKLSRDEGITVLFSSHHLHQVQQVCDRVGLFVGGRLLAQGDIPQLAQSLLNDNLYAIEAAIDHPDEKILSDVLMSVNGVMSVERRRDLFHIRTNHDVTAVIAQRVIEAGGALTYLNRVEYGLDEIYCRYFEGGSNHDVN